MTSQQQSGLLPGLEGPARESHTTPATENVALRRPQPSPDPVDTLLNEVERDSWSLLDPRNWHEDGPTDQAILARYRAIGTDTYDAWPNVSGSRMYDLVWPSLRLTHHVPEEQILAACQTCRTRHLSDTLAYVKNGAMQYSIMHDLIEGGIWNGDSWTMYTSLAHFANQPIDPLSVLVAEAIQATIHDAAATFHTALAARHRSPRELRPSKRAGKQENEIEPTITRAREQLKTLRGYQHSLEPARTLLQQATIGPRFNDPIWTTLKEGDPLPALLIHTLLADSPTLSTRGVQLPITEITQ